MTVQGQKRPALRVAIVGTGPRGVSVLERLTLHLVTAPLDADVTIYLVDAVELGAGRIWRTDQPPWFTMNTVVSELTMFSGGSDGRACQPGAGCSFAQWLRRHSDPALADLQGDDYAPRYAYGQYLVHVYQRALRSLRGVARVHEFRGRLIAIHLTASAYRLHALVEGNDLHFDVDAAVLATGHGRNELTGSEKMLAEAADQVPELRYLSGDSAADLDLAAVPEAEPMGVIGLGLSFYDVVLAMTVGRGGQFATTARGTLSYRPSGREPVIVAGSRSGLVVPTRGRNQKPSADRPRLRFLTFGALATLREAACRATGRAALDFDRDILPLLIADVTLVYYTAQARRLDADAAEKLSADLIAAGSDIRKWLRIVAEHGLPEVRPLDLQRLARPFDSARFATPEAFTTALHDILERDLKEAKQGNVAGPLKAALDVIRDAREVLRAAVEFSGLTPVSHRRAFMGRFAPVSSLLSTGPPLRRTRQLLALIDAGIVQVTGPATTFGFDSSARRFVVESPHVAGSRRHVRTLVDARIPIPDLHRNTDPLIRQLVADDVGSEFVNDDGEERFATGGLSITPAEYRLVSGTGEPRRSLYAIGIPTENPRWFTQIGNGRPGITTGFMRDAEAVVVSLLRRATAFTPCRSARAGGHF